MSFKEWSESQFDLTKLENGKIQFKTPCIDYTFDTELLKYLKKLFNEFDN